MSEKKSDSVSSESKGGGASSSSNSTSTNNDRVVKDVVAPPLYPLTMSECVDKKGNIDLDVLKEHLLKEGRLGRKFAEFLVAGAQALFKKEPNMLHLQYPITVCGDVHGQFFDLVRLFEIGGDPKDTQFLFLGDYVDRGCFSTEVVFFLYALKITYPKTFYMLRGNHECRQLTAFFNFKDECVYKYDEQLYHMVMNSFDALPLAAIVNKAFFCVHGGLSPDVSTLDEIREINRFQEIPREGSMCDLLWSDPFEEEEDDSRTLESTSWFGYNQTRQCSYVYGVEAVKQFLKDNKLTSVIRAHEAQVDGYKMQMINQFGIPRVITIFSAPNYCDVYKNKAACLKFDHNVLNIKQFVDSPHPYYLPNFMDAFQWSLPFMAEKVTDMLAALLDYPDSDSEDSDQPSKPTVIQAQGGRLKKKVMAVTKLLRMYRVLRQENENIMQLKQLRGDSKLPRGLLSEGAVAIANAISDFDKAREADMSNEKMPGSAPTPKNNGTRRFRSFGEKKSGGRSGGGSFSTTSTSNSTGGKGGRSGSSGRPGGSWKSGSGGDSGPSGLKKDSSGKRERGK